MAQRSMLSFLSKKVAKPGGEEAKKRKRCEDAEPDLIAATRTRTGNVGVQRKDSGIGFGPGLQAPVQPGQGTNARGKAVEPDVPSLFDGVGLGSKPAAESQEGNEEILHVYKKRARISKVAPDAGEDDSTPVGEIEEGNAETSGRERVRKRNRLLQSVGADDCAGPQHSAAWQEAAARFEWLDPGMY